MENIKSILVVCMLIVIIFLTMMGCGGLKVEYTNSACREAPDNSVICNIFNGDVESVNAILIITNITAIKKKLIKKKQILNTLERAESKLKEIISYKVYADFINNLIHNSVGFNILSDHAFKFSKHSRIISNFDKELILKHIKNQKEVINSCFL